MSLATALLLGRPAVATAGPDAPPLPPPPQVAAPACHMVATPVGTWSRVLDETMTGTPVYQLVVDPWTPCLEYRMRDDHTVERSVDGGQRWLTVFRDQVVGSAAPQDPTCAGAVSACALSASFAVSSISVPAPRMVALSEWGNGDALVISTDAGTTWHLADHGIEGLPIATVQAAPGDGSVLYATIAPRAVKAISGSGGLVPAGANPAELASGQHLLAASLDGGGSWSLEPLPCPAYTESPRSSGLRWFDGVAVDPVTPTHIWCLQHLGHVGQAALNQAADGITVVWESRDHGASWSSAPPLQNGTSTQLLPVRTQSGVRLLLGGGFNNPATSVMYSDDDASTWRTTGLPVFSYSYNDVALAADPLHPGLVAAAVPLFGGAMQLYVSNDAFDHHNPTGASFSVMAFDAHLQVGVITPLLVGPPATDVVLTPVLPGTPASQWTSPPSTWLQASTTGDLYVALRSCNLCTSQPDTLRMEYWRVHPVLTGTPIAAPALPPAPLPSISSATPWPAPCLLPARADGSGSIAYDGKELVFGSTTVSGPSFGTGVLNRIDPVTCAALPDLVVQFSPDDMARFAQAGGGDRVILEGLTYDPRRNAFWVTANTSGDPRSLHPLFLVDHFDRAASTATGHLQAFTACAARLTYDVWHDTLWTCTATGGWGEIRAVDGAPVDTCMSALSEAGSAETMIPDGADTWTVGGPRQMFVESEDDTTIYTVDDAACTITGASAHATTAEAREDNQIACDALTAGAASPPLVWLRDGDGHVSADEEFKAYTARAYAMPGASCPLPTRTVVPDLSAAAGAQVDVCAQVDHIFPGGAEPSVQVQVHLTVSGPGIPAVDLGTTAAVGGRACLPWTVAVPAGTYTAHAATAGDDRHLPSSGNGRIRVGALSSSVGVAALPRPFAAITTLSPPPPPPQLPAAADSVPQLPPAPASAAEAAQAQAQGQAQSQAMTQAQPGVMVQQRSQPQVAVQTMTSDRRMTQPALLARRVAPAGAVALALLSLVTLRRPHVAVAIARARRRRP